jgi:hypothetical protein
MEGALKTDALGLMRTRELTGPKNEGQSVSQSK